MFRALQRCRFSSTEKVNQSVPKLFNPGCPLNFKAKTMTCNLYYNRFQTPNTLVIFISKTLICLAASIVFGFGYRSFKKRRYFRVILFWTPLMAIIASSYLSNSMYRYKVIRSIDLKSCGT